MRPSIVLSLSLSLASALAACAPTVPLPEPRPLPTPNPQACNAAAAQFAVGQAVSDALVLDALRRSGAQQVRLIRPGQAVTLEFNPTRLNIDLDAANRVRAVRCG